jgi:hypothetical protein
MAVKHSDPKPFILPDLMARDGFILGVTFQGRPIDEIVRMPAASKEVRNQIETCMGELRAHIEEVIKQR